MSTFNLSNVDLNSLDDLGAHGLTDEQPVMKTIKRQRNTSLNANLNEAVKLNPDVQARNADLSRQSGVPVGAVASDPDSIDLMINQQRIDADTLQRKSPRTANYLNDYNRASISHDDIERLTAIESTLTLEADAQGQKLQPVPVHIASTVASRVTELVGSLYGLAAQGGEALDEAMPMGGFVFENSLIPRYAGPEEWQRLREQGMQDLVKETGKIISETDFGYVPRSTWESTKQAYRDEGVSLGSVGETLAFGFEQGVHSLADMAAVYYALPTYIGARSHEMGEIRAKIKGKDATIEESFEALPFAVGSAVLEMALPLFVFKVLGKKQITQAGKEILDQSAKRLKKVMAAAGSGLIIEASTEAIQEGVIEYVGERYGTDAELVLHEALDRALGGAVGGGIAGAGFAGIAESVNVANNTIEQNKIKAATDKAAQLDMKANREQRDIDSINGSATDSKLRERSVEDFKQFVDEADGDNNTRLFIDGVQTKLYLADKQDQIETDPALQLLNEKANEAAALGGDLSIPVSEFAATLAGTDHFTNLRDFMSLSEETASPYRQEETQAETQGFIGNLINQAQDNSAQYAESQQLFETVRDQLIDTGVISAQNASVLAEIVPAWATVYAERNGVTVQEAYDLTIEGPQTGEAARLDREGKELLEQEGVGDFADYLQGKSKSTSIGQEKGRLNKNGVSVLTATNTPSDQFISRRYVKSEDGEIIGTVQVTSTDGGKTATIANAVTRTDKQRQGIATELLTRARKDFESVSHSDDLSTSGKAFASSDTLRQDESDGVTRGYYSPSESMIRLTESADLSTFLHEFAHFMYEMELTTSKASPDSINTIQSIHNWFKRNSDDVAKEANKYLGEDEITGEIVVAFLDNGTVGNVKHDESIRRAVHEQFARGFETYVMEGKAPSAELRSAFATFARWLTQIYRAVRGDLKVNLDEQMREVFGRLLATEEQINAAESRAQYEPLFTDAAMAGMTEEEFKAYKERQSKVKDVQVEELRDKLIKQLTRQAKSWWKEEKADLVTEQTKQLSKEPVYRARDALKNTNLKLDRATVKELVGTERTDSRGRKSIIMPPALNGTTVTGGKGLHPDEVAGLFGYGSGSELLSDLVDAAPIKAKADANAELQMIDKHGDILNDGTIQAHADEAVQSEERGKMLLDELKALRKRAASAPILDRMMIKKMAEENISKLSFREIQPGKYRKAEIKAAQEAATALANGETDKAAQAKVRQILNYYLGMEATRARANTMMIVDRMARYNKKAVREEIMKAENGYWEQLSKILSRFQFRKSASIKSVENINIWAKNRIENEGDALLLSAEVLDDTFITHWKNIPFAELLGVADSVKNIEHVARYSNTIKRKGEEISFKKLVKKWTGHMDEQSVTRFTPQRTGVVEGKKWGRWAMAQMTKIPFMASWLDGGERAGMSHEILTQPFTDAYAAELRLWDEVGSVVMSAIENRSKADIKRHNKKLFIPEIKDADNDGNLFGSQVLAVALNTGNEGNLKKMLLGEGWANPNDESTIDMSNPQLQAILAHMTKSDWELVQLIWDQMETLYPQLQDVHRRTTGLTPPKVKAVPVRTEFGEFRGGYYPVKYDPNRSERAKKHQDKLDAETDSMFSNSSSIHSSVTTGVTNERTGFYDAIRLSLDVVPAHFQEAIHYITHHDAVREANKLINDPSVAKMIKKKLGPEEYAQLRPWLNDISKDGRESVNKMFWDDAVGRLRFGTTLGTMGFKASTGIIQISGLFNSIAELGIAPMLQSMRSILGSRQDMKDAWDFASSNSKVLEHRVQTMDREIKHAMKRLEGKTGLLAAVQEASMKHIALIQTYMVDLPTWQAAYIKEMKDSGDEQKAYARADWTIENIQGSGVTKDMSRIMRRQSETGRMLTMFMTFFSSLWNIQRDLVKGARSGRYSTTSLAAKGAFLFTLPVLFEMMMRGELFDEDEDAETQLQKMLTKVALYPVASIPFVRDISTAVAGDFGYNISPVAALIEQGTRTIPEIVKNGFTDDEITLSQAKGATKFTAAALGIPGTGQAWATGEHLFDVLEEGEEFTLHQLLFGPERD